MDIRRGDAFGDAGGGAFDDGTQPHLVGQHIGRAGGQNAQRHLGEGHSFGDLVDGAVASRGQDQLGAVGDTAAGDGSRGARALGGNQPGVMSRFAQDLGGGVTGASAPWRPSCLQRDCR